MNVLTVLQVVVSILLIVSILLQSRGAGLGGSFGGDSSGFHTKRGIEKFLMNFSVVLSFLFIVLSVVNIAY